MNHHLHFGVKHFDELISMSITMHTDIADTYPVGVYKSILNIISLFSIDKQISNQIAFD